MDELIIRTENLYKSYTAVDYDIKGIRRFTKAGKKIHALENLNLEIAPGELVGLIGANGAGKSTSIKLLTGILHPTSGNVFTFGRDPARFRRKNADRIGVMMGQRSQLWWDLPALDSFQLYACLLYTSQADCRLPGVRSGAGGNGDGEASGPGQSLQRVYRKHDWRIFPFSCGVWYNNYK